MDTNLREIVAQVLGAHDIVDLLGGYIALKPSGGGRFKGLCPFHNEKTPSFTVNRDRQNYYCFGCEKHGDAISFLSDHDGLSFMEALQHLADRAGIRLPKFTGRVDDSDSQRRELLEFSKTAAKLYRDQLANPMRGEPGRAYIAGRQFRPETINRFGVGFAPDDWHALTNHARQLKVHDRVVEASGLARRGERGDLHDFFRNRVIFPIKDVTGNVVAFGGRDLGDSQAKYINSPENAIYKKARTLYGLYEAREAIRESKRAILVEGYFDLLRCFDSGIENVVATCGTALTLDQAKLIRRYAPEVLVLFDGDAAGVKAALRGIGILTTAGLSVRALALPDGHDPDDYIRAHGAEAFLELAQGALDFISFYVEMQRDRAGTIEGRTELAHEVFEIFTHIDDGVQRTEYLRLMARQLGLETRSTLFQFEIFYKKRQRPGSTNDSVPAQKTTMSFSREDVEFVALLLDDPGRRVEAKESVGDLTFEAEGPIERILAAVLASSAGSVGPRDLEDGPAQALLAAASNFDGVRTERADVLFRERLDGLHRDHLRGLAKGVQEQIEATQRSGGGDALSLVKEKIRIEQEIQRLGAKGIKPLLTTQAG